MLRACTVLRERVLEHMLYAGSWFFDPEAQAFLACPSYDVPLEALGLLRIDVDTLASNARSRPIGEVVRALDRRPQDGLLAGCGFSHAYAFGPDALELRARVGGLGGALGCLAFDAAGDHLVLGSNWREYVKVVDAHSWEFAGRGLAGRVTAIARTRLPHEVALLHGPTGRVSWFDCVTRRVTHRAEVPPFEGVAGDADRLFLATGDPEPTGFAPITYANPFVPPSGEGRVVGRAPIPGTERVQIATGVALLDLAGRSIVARAPTPPYGDFPWAMLQRSASGERVFLLSRGRVRSVRADDLEVEWTASLPEASLPLTVLGEGEGAVVGLDRNVWRRIARVELAGRETLDSRTVGRMLGVLRA